ncbi:hypothetical protein [Nocardiopsis sp. FR26]|uniref:hypothetical protein n=1 Tax=Nocardiopsis sp. FR26 TaxID=2605987 RepID=UPI00135A3463|nr:hypothetical protein [Nocardiopsis sp. FR26]
MSDEAQEQRTGSAAARVGFGGSVDVSVRPKNPVKQVVTSAGVISLDGASDETRASVALLLAQRDSERAAREKAEADMVEARRENRANRVRTWISIGIAVAALVVSLLGWLSPMSG